MILLLKRAAALLLAVVLAAPGTPALAQEYVKAVPAVAPAAGSPAAGASALAPLSPGLTVPASPALAAHAAAVPPIAAADNQAERYSVPAAAAAKTLPAASVEKTAAAASAEKSRASDSQLLRSAQAVADGLTQEKKDDGELPPPSDALDSLAQATLEVDPSRSYHASPDDWRDESVYSVLLDRFNKSENAKPYGDAKNGLTRHGGDIRGLIEKLDYIEAGGWTTILVSPVTMTIPEAYHGYAAVHFLSTDPRLGTMADFKELVAKAHARNIRVVLDWLVNHTGPVFEYADGKTQWTGDGKPGPVEWTRKLKPVELTEEDFTRERVITNWNDPVQATHGDFPPNYRHLATDRPATQEKLIHLAEWWVKETDVDGLRLDAVRHVAPGFLPRFKKEMKEFAAAKLGKKNFLLIGEDSTGVDEELKPYVENGSVDTLYNYPAFRRENRALHGAAPTRDLETSRSKARSILGEMADRLLRFIDLHDVYRFLLAETPGGLLRTAHAYLMLTAGIPLGYYGTEQAFRQLRGRLEPEDGKLPADPQNREDMFPSGQYKSESSSGDKFDVGSPSFKFVRAMNDLRKAYPALRRGAQFERWSDPDGPGIYAFSRIYDGQEVLVVLNTSGDARGAEMWVDAEITRGGSVLEDALNPDYRVTAEHEVPGGAKVSILVPPYGARVMIRK
ncbi:MAG: alpha-amylase family glycosyl hydrolase [Elusimicrobiota bacterium]